jgi:hypothetical protein
MARDGAGNFSLPYPDFVAGTTIESAQADANNSDIATALTASLAKDGQTVPTANLPMGGFKHTGVAAASALTHYARADQVVASVLDYAIDTGTATAYAIAPTPGILAYVVGQRFAFKATNANSGADPTLAVNTLTAGIIYWPNGDSLAAGDIPASAQIVVQVATVTTGTPTYHLQTLSKRPLEKTLMDAKGDLITATADNTPSILSAGSNGRVLMARSADTKGLAYVPALTGIINGLTYANNGSDATNDIDIAAGGCMDATGAYWMQLSALTKRLDASWAVGTNQGGLDTGSIADTDYYIWAIARSDTGVTDALFSTSATAPTMPTNYDFKRLIGWFKRASSAIVAFKTYETATGGLEFLWVTPREDIRLSATLTSTRRTDALSVPLNFSTVAFITPSFYDTAGLAQVRICCPDEADAAVYTPDGAYSTGARNGNMYSINASLVSFGDLRIRTDSTGKIAARASAGITADLYVVQTNGFEWSRR